MLTRILRALVVISAVVLAATLVFQAVLGMKPNCQEAAQDLLPYEHCIKDNMCRKDVNFYIQYYDIRREMRLACDE